MSARLLDGKQLAQALRNAWRARVDRLGAAGIVPGLAAVVVGEDPASRIYVRNKISACAELGMHSEEHRLPEQTELATLLALIDRLNADPQVHGILVQLPLPPHLPQRAIIERIDPEKDVDGLNERNLGALLAGHARFVPCTPLGIMELLKAAEQDLNGRQAVVVGRSNIVGKPIALLLMQAGATVTLCHSRTRELAQHTRRADVLVAALGKAQFIRADMIKPGAVVIDVGINRTPAGKLVGDVATQEAQAVAAWITPVPGGVGPMTIAMLLGNTLTAAERRAHA